MASEVEIINMALGRIGEAFITLRTDNSREANAANAIYDINRDILLGQGLWNNATTRASLGLVASTDPRIANLEGFDNAFALPHDFVWLSPHSNLKRKYRLENGLLLTNLDAVCIVYVSNNIAIYKNDGLFVEALSYKLAMELSIALRGSSETHNMMRQYYDKALDDARFRNLSTGGTDNSLYWNRGMWGGIDGPYSDIRHDTEYNG